MKKEPTHNGTKYSPDEIGKEFVRLFLNGFEAYKKSLDSQGKNYFKGRECSYLEKSIASSEGLSTPEVVEIFMEDHGDHLPLLMHLRSTAKIKGYGLYSHASEDFLMNRQELLMETKKEDFDPENLFRMLSENGTKDYVINLSILGYYCVKPENRDFVQVVFSPESNYDLRLFLSLVERLLQVEVPQENGRTVPFESILEDEYKDANCLGNIFLHKLIKTNLEQKSGNLSVINHKQKQKYKHTELEVSLFNGLKQEALRDLSDNFRYDPTRKPPLDWWLEMNGSRVFKDNAHLNNL